MGHAWKQRPVLAEALREVANSEWILARVRTQPEPMGDGGVGLVQRQVEGEAELPNLGVEADLPEIMPVNALIHRLPAARGELLQCVAAMMFQTGEGDGHIAQAAGHGHFRTLGAIHGDHQGLTAEHAAAGGLGGQRISGGFTVGKTPSVGVAGQGVAEARVRSVIGARYARVNDQFNIRLDEIAGSNRRKPAGLLVPGWCGNCPCPIP